MADVEVIVHSCPEQLGKPIVLGRSGCTCRPLSAIAQTISQAEQDHHAMLRHRSYELAIARGHMRIL